tara:strand:+ start:3405 stop:3896 length:492 start_codon:yes stop_codon:yes gene_type:complete
MARVKVWIARCDPWDFFVDGVQRFTLFFQKPEYIDTVFECPMFGPLKRSNYVHGYWNQQGLEFRVFRKLFPELADKVFEDALACYIPVPDNENPYVYLKQVYDTERQKILGGIYHTGESVEEIAKEDAHFHELEKEVEKAIELPNRLWREHLLEYEIDMSLVK